MSTQYESPAFSSQPWITLPLAYNPTNQAAFSQRYGQTKANLEFAKFKPSQSLPQIQKRLLQGRTTVPIPTIRSRALLAHSDQCYLDKELLSPSDCNIFGFMFVKFGTKIKV